MLDVLTCGKKVSLTRLVTGVLILTYLAKTYVKDVLGDVKKC